MVPRRPRERTRAEEENDGDKTSRWREGIQQDYGEINLRLPPLVLVAFVEVPGLYRGYFEGSRKLIFSFSFTFLLHNSSTLIAQDIPTIAKTEEIN